MSYIKQPFYLVLLLLLPYLSFGQKVEFDHLSNDQGMVGSKVTTILKDYQGYMWFGTYDGLSRYDGYSFSNFVNDPMDTSSILDNFIACLFETKDCVLYIGVGYKGLCIFDRETETFSRFSHNDKDPYSIIQNFVSTIYEDKKGNLWIATKGGLDRLDRKTNKFYHYKAFSSDEPAVTSITEDEENNLWLFGKSKTLCRFNPEKNIYTYYQFPGKMNPEKFYRGGVIKYDSHHNLWLGENGGLLRYNVKTGETVEYSVKNKKLSGDLIFSIIEDSQKNIWIGSDGGGLYRYNYQLDVMDNFQHHPDDETSLSGNGVYCVYESEPGLIWAGTYSSGVSIYKKDKRKFQSISLSGKPHQRLNRKSVLSIAESKEGSIWFGTDGGGLNLYNPKTKNVQYFTSENSELKSGVIKCIARDKNEDLWLGSYGKSLQKINFDKKTSFVFKVGKDPEKSLLIDNVWSLFPAKDGKIFIGLLGRGLQIYDPSTGRFKHYPYNALADKIYMCDISVFLADHTDRIWIGSQESGLGYYDSVHDSIVHVLHDPKIISSISSDKVSDIFEDSRHTLWVGTMFNGLNKLIDKKKGTFKRYTVKDGLASNNIKSILEDDHGNLWLSTDNGISLFKVSENKFINFGMEDGLINREFNFTCKLKTEDGTIYFGGINGVTMFHPDSMKFNVHIPQVSFTQLKIFDQPIRPYVKHEGKIYLKNSMSLTHELVFTNEDYMFSIEFTALDFISPDQNKYAYQLEGFSNKWTFAASDKRVATYTNLDPGNYTFKVIACNNDGVWNMDGISLKIKILPPWYETWWFRLLMVISLLLVLISYYYIRISSINKRNKILSEKVKVRTQELKLANESLTEQKEEILLQKDELENKKRELEHSNKTKDKFFSILGHDLKGPVNALNSLAKMLRTDWINLEDELKLEFVSHIDKSSLQVKNLVLSLLEWARTQSDQVKTKVEQLSALKLFSDTHALLSEQANQKQLQITVDVDQTHYIFGDYNMVSTIIRNILSNSIKYTPKGGAIKLSSSIINDDYLRLSITDTGVGIPPETLASLFSLDKGPSAKGTENETGTGLGLVICHEFAEMNKGKIYAESVLGEGSTFYILLPRKK